MKKIDIDVCYKRLCSSVSTEHFDPIYQMAAYNFLELIIDYLETRSEELVTLGNVFCKLETFCTEANKNEESGYKIYMDKLSNDHSKSSAALSYLSEKTLNDVYSFFQTLIIATKANLEGNN